MEGDVIQMQEIFQFVRTGMEADGKILGHFEATGIRPRFLEDLQRHGHRVSRASISSPASRWSSRCSSALYVFYAGAALFGIIVAEAIYLLLRRQAGSARGHQPAHEAAGRRRSARSRC